MRDTALGFTVFTTLAVGLCGGLPGTAMEASASGALVAEALALTAPPGVGSENALVAALVSAAPMAGRIVRPEAFFILAGAFALMFAMNLAIMRHLRRVYASPRRSAGRGGS